MVPLHRAAAGVLYIGGSYVPAVGDVVQLTYTAWHTIEGIDAAAATTIPVTHEYMFANGAAGKCAMMRGVQIVEAYGKKAGEPEKLKDWAYAMVTEFLNELVTLKSNQAIRGMPAKGWVLDAWDR